MNRPPVKYTVLLALAVIALAISGCKKTEAEKQAAAKAREAAMATVTPSQAAEAKEAVKQAWDDVKQCVARDYARSSEDMDFYLDLAVLTKHPHRLAGYGDGQTDAPGSLYAAKYVADRLMSMGFRHVVKQDFPVIQAVTTQCEMVVDGQTHPIYAARPNILQAPVTPVEGIVGETLYVRRGETVDYGRNYAKDKIVVMDFDCDLNWLNAFAFGARAVLFVGSDTPAANAYHHLNLPANLPRFYVPKDLAAKLKLTGDPQTVKILAACQWRQLTGRNVITVVRGTDPRFAPDRPDQAIVLAAPLDSYSEIPLLSRGARDAANCAALLKIAERVKSNPPKRDVIICFFDAQANNHMGARAFYGSMNRRVGNSKIAEKDLEARLVRLDQERQYRKQIGEIIDTVKPLVPLWREFGNLHARGKVLLEEKDELALQQSDLKAEMELLRKQQSNTSETEGSDPEIDRKLQACKRQLEATTARLDARTPEIDATMSSLNKRMSEVDQQITSPEMTEIDLFSAQVQSMPKHVHAVRFLRDEAKNFDSEVLDKLRPLRVRNRELTDSKKDLTAQNKALSGKIDKLNQNLAKVQQASDEHARIAQQISESEELVSTNQSRIKELAGQIARQHEQVGVLEERDMGWNTVLRDLYDKKVTKASRGRFARLLEESQKVLKQRLAELDQLTERANKDLVLRNSFGPKQNAIVLHVAINLGDGRDAWTFIHGDNSEPQNEDKTGNYSAIFRVMRNIHKTSPEMAPKFDSRAISENYENRLFCPALYADSSCAASIFSIYNLSAMTSLDRLPRNGLPSDTPEALDAGRIQSQLSELSPFLMALADHDGMNVTPTIRPEARITEGGWSSNKGTGPSVKQAGAGSAMPDRPVRGAIVAMVRSHASGPWAAGRLTEVPAGFIFPMLYKTDMNGIFEAGPYSKHRQSYGAARTFVATFDKTPVGDDEIPDSYTTRGLIKSVVTSQKLTTDYGKLNNKAIHLFRAKSKTIVGYGYNRGSIVTTTMRAQSTAKFRADRHLQCEMDNILTLYAPYDSKGMKAFCKTGLAMLNNKPSKGEYQGKGISLDDPFDHPVSARDSAHDFLALNGYRLKLLRNSRIMQESLEKMQGEASDIKADADAQITEVTPGQAELKSPLDPLIAGYESSAAHSRRTYNPLKAVMNDLVTAVVLLLLLAMPFAYALERLLIGTPHIYRQIGWFAAFFLITFAVLFMVNPAFQIAATPIIIFLAFTIILLSSLVIFILVRKLQVEIRKMQGLGTTVHSADVSRLSTMSAAVNMGISTMRRRPVRTLLTAITVVLLTFTILTFASFGSTWGLRESYEGPMTGAPYRSLIRHQLWSPVGEGVHSTLRGFFQGAADVVPRYWVAPTAQQAKDIQENKRDAMDMLVASSNLEHISPIAAAIGLDIRDVQQQPHFADLFLEPDPVAGKPRDLAQFDLLEDGIILTQAVRDELHLSDDDVGKAKVVLAGHELVFAGVVSDRLGSFTLLDGSMVLPVDYQASAGSSVDTFAEESTTESLSEMPDVESAQFVYFNVDQVVIVSPKTAKLLRGQVRAVTIYPHDEEEIDKISRQAAKIAELPIYMGSRAGVTRMIFTSLTEASGARDLLVPVLLGGMIIFATMLGSVSDREREIYTFSSLGLAPAHVASLFFAEASIYAVVGGMGGYLLGQIVARVLGYLAALGWMSVPSMNYSSTNAIVTVLIVMGTVLISTIYPAMKASRSANPGIQRSWKIPSPEGNLYDLIFPFTVSAYDIIGVVSFLKEHFDNYSDTSLGVFTSMDCAIFRQKTNDMLGFRASVALAPFDLGVTQDFALLSQASEIEGIDEVRILIYRRSGAHGDWQRSNRVFINELRKQLLIWRSLPQDIMDKYRQNTLDTWDNLPVEQIDGESIGGSA